MSKNKRGFSFVMNQDQREKLRKLAEKEGRSMGGMLKRLIEIADEQGQQQPIGEERSYESV